ncbi:MULTISPECIES: hypothetical protein [Halobacillus]|uniref:hypothetical protein n=1 Tax=Halobacillus TaxID=45667 RepID=UPI0009A6F03C|nr:MULTISPECIES: hypothetical protein [Halobacillus]
MKCIIFPLVIKVLKNDKKLFQEFKMRNVYLDKVDSVIESVQTDLNHVKQQMYSVYHVDIKQLNQKGEVLQYKWTTRDQDGIIELSSSQLREHTKNMLQEYFYGSLAKPYKPKVRTWDE